MKFVAFARICACELHCLEGGNSKRSEMESKLYKKKETPFRSFDLKTALLLTIGEKSEVNLTQGGSTFQVRSIVDATGMKYFPRENDRTWKTDCSAHLEYDGRKRLQI